MSLATVYQKISAEELDIMIDLVYDKYKGINGDYDLLCRLLKAEFDVEVSSRDIWAHFEPNIEEEELDRVLLYKNLGYY